MGWRALYVVFAVDGHMTREPGEIVSHELKVKGFAGACFDYPRGEFEGVFRYCVDQSFRLGAVDAYRVDQETGHLMWGESIVVENHPEFACMSTLRIEDCGGIPA